MNLYRIMHIPTGLYYKGGHINLSEKGKVYIKRPHLGMIHNLWISKITLKRLFKKNPNLINSLEFIEHRYKDSKREELKFELSDFKIESVYMTDIDLECILDCETYRKID